MIKAQTPPRTTLDTDRLRTIVEQRLLRTQKRERIPYSAVRRWIASWGETHEVPAPIAVNTSADAVTDTIFFTPQTLDDLAYVNQLTRRGENDATTPTAQQLLQAFTRLNYLPEPGAPGCVPGTRQLSVMSYLVIYRPLGIEIEILCLFKETDANDR